MAAARQGKIVPTYKAYVQQKIQRERVLKSDAVKKARNILRVHGRTYLLRTQHCTSSIIINPEAGFLRKIDLELGLT